MLAHAPTDTDGPVLPGGFLGADTVRHGCRAQWRMTSDQPPPHRAAPALRRAQQEGFAARSSGVARGANPYVRAETLPHIDVAQTETRKAAAEAWWRGWDHADAELAQPRTVQ